MSQLQKFESSIKEAKNVQELFQIPDVRDRFVKNYQSVTGRKDGENRLEQERFAYLQIVSDKPELQKINNFYHVAALIYAGTTGLSFRDNKLYVYPNGKGGLKVQSSPAGKREMFEMMPSVKRTPEAVVVFKGDNFVVDKMNHVVKEHYSTKETKESNSLDNVRAVYQRIEYKDGTIIDVVMYHDELLKAKSKSKTREGGPWVDWPVEMCKKTVLNRAFRLYHHYPDNVVLYGPPVEDAEDTGYSEVNDDAADVVITDSGYAVDKESGEVVNPLPGEEEKPGSFI